MSRVTSCRYWLAMRQQVAVQGYCGEKGLKADSPHLCLRRKEENNPFLNMKSLRDLSAYSKHPIKLAHLSASEYQKLQLPPTQLPKSQTSSLTTSIVFTVNVKPTASWRQSIHQHKNQTEYETVQNIQWALVERRKRSGRQCGPFPFQFGGVTSHKVFQSGP